MRQARLATAGRFLIRTKLISFWESVITELPYLAWPIYPADHPVHHPLREIVSLLCRRS